MRYGTAQCPGDALYPAGNRAPASVFPMYLYINCRSSDFLCLLRISISLRPFASVAGSRHVRRLPVPAGYVGYAAVPPCSESHPVGTFRTCALAETGVPLCPSTGCRIGWSPTARVLCRMPQRLFRLVAIPPPATIPFLVASSFVRPIRNHPFLWSVAFFVRPPTTIPSFGLLPPLSGLPATIPSFGRPPSLFVHPQPTFPLVGCLFCLAHPQPVSFRGQTFLLPRSLPMAFSRRAGVALQCTYASSRSAGGISSGAQDFYGRWCVLGWLLVCCLGN